ncbi:PA2169 family four-helix-bundle protein [Marilutibacter aestuarii]|uniref:PA2169 family four-helix-bundle protein n=1 Tax=Marilutibacter aestuarii TaxID=1706195 RepID=A0A508A6R1_9GAMM|nr:PA2169 family four-helix-bundle protein [Lysobacter aestuarii]TQD45669.1 PA2169 family four-helix-bundle protein [Lysobacter aestuarii]
MNTTSQHIRNEKIETLNELIEVSRDSAQFYADAASKVDNPQLKQLFTGMAESKNGLVGALARDVRAEGASPAKSGTFRGSLHEFYGDIRAKLGDKDYAYVSELEESEDRMLDAMRDVIEDNGTPAQVKTAVSGYLPKVKAQHDLMRDRKWAMKSAH